MIQPTPLPINTDGVLTVCPTTGNDATGLVGRAEFPFKTLSAAQTAASSGQTIRVYPGTYTVSTGLGKSGVNWELLAGANLTANPSGSADFAIFGDGGSAMTYTVSGAGTLTMTGSYSALSHYLDCVACTNSSSVITVRVSKISQQASLSSLVDLYAAGVRCSAGRLLGGCSILEATGTSGVGISYLNGDFYYEPQFINASTVDKAAIYSWGTASPVGVCDIVSQRIAGEILNVSPQTDARLYVRTGQLDALYTAVYSSGGKTYINAAKIAGNTQSDATQGVVQLDGGELWLHVQKITGTYATALLNNGGLVWKGPDEIEDLGFMTQLVLTEGNGTCYLGGLLRGSALIGDGAKCTSGQLFLVGCHFTTSGIGKFDLVQSGSGQILVAGGFGNITAPGLFTISGSIIYLNGGGKPPYYHGV